MSDANGVNGVSGIVPCFNGDDMIAPVLKVTDHLSERGPSENCLSSRGSRASSLGASKVKVRLARLALKHEEKRQQEATGEKMTQFEMAELEAWKASSVSSRSVKINEVSNTATPCREISPCLDNTLKKLVYVLYLIVQKILGLTLLITPNIALNQSNKRQSRAVNPFSLGPQPLEVSERFLPKPSIDPFDGYPLNYWAFVPRYEVHIAGRNKQLAYEAVWKEIYQTQGQPHIISRCCEEPLTSVGKIKQAEVEGLEKLAVLAKRCLISLKETLGPTAIDWVKFIASIANKLSNDLRRQWVFESVKILHRKGRMANFADFANFVSMEALKMNSVYYKAMFTTSKHESSAWVEKGRSFNNVTPSLQKLPRKAQKNQKKFQNLKRSFRMYVLRKAT